MKCDYISGILYVSPSSPIGDHYLSFNFFSFLFFKLTFFFLFTFVHGLYTYGISVYIHSCLKFFNSTLCLCDWNMLMHEMYIVYFNFYIYISLDKYIRNCFKWLFITWRIPTIHKCRVVSWISRYSLGSIIAIPRSILFHPSSHLVHSHWYYFEANPIYHHHFPVFLDTWNSVYTFLNFSKELKE